MGGALDILNGAEKDFARERGLPGEALDGLHALRRAQTQNFPTPWHQLAVWVVAPVLAGYAQWMAEQAVPQRSSVFLGVMREGRLLAHLMRGLFGVPAREVWLNRNLAMMAAFACGDDEALLNWLVRTRLRPLSVAQATRQVLGKETDGASGRQPLDLEQVQHLLEAWAKSGDLAEARRRAMPLADRLVMHWRKTVEGTLPPGMVFLMDFASVGNIQRSLQTVFAAKKMSVPLMGLNFCMTAGSRWAEEKGCAMRGYLAMRGEPEWIASAYTRTPELIEIFTAEPVGSLESYRESGAPICKESFLTAQQQALMRDVQEHILGAAIAYHRQIGKSLTADLARCLWGRLLLRPLKHEVDALASWPLDAGLDGEVRRVLAAPLAGSAESWTKMDTAWPAASKILSNP